MYYNNIKIVLSLYFSQVNNYISVSDDHAKLASVGVGPRHVLFINFLVSHSPNV